MANQLQKATIASFNKVTGTGRVTILGGATIAALNFPAWSDPGFDSLGNLTPAQLELYTQAARSYLEEDSPYLFTLSVQLTYAYGDEVLVMDVNGRKVILGVTTVTAGGGSIPGNATTPPAPPAPPVISEGQAGIWQAPVQTKEELLALSNPLIGQTHMVIAECAYYTWAPSCGGWMKVPFGGGSTSGLLDHTKTVDGAFGYDGISVAGLADGDTYDEAFDKVDTLLSKLLPPRPKNLRDVPLQILGAYPALQQATGVRRESVIDSSVPVARADNFFDGSRGTLTGFVDGTLKGTLPITEGVDVVLSTPDAPLDVEILADVDPYAGITGKKGFWQQLSASVTTRNPLSLGGSGHEFKLVHSLTGTAVATAYVDDPKVPVVKNKGLLASGASGLISGVPCLKVGDSIRATFDVEDAVSEFYHLDYIARIESPVFNPVNAPLPDPAPLKGDVVHVVDLAGAVLPNLFAADAAVTLRGYNAKGVVTNLTVTNHLRVDSLSNESLRVKSGTSQFPSKGAAGFGDAYDSAELLTANEELQLEGGRFKYPSATDYSTLVPVAGPNYSALAAGSYLGMRWVTFQLDQVYGVSNLRLDMVSATGFTDPQQPGFAMYVLIDGATGWLDANKAYPGVGAPVNNGDAALDLARSTATSRRITLGAIIRSGVVYVRVGIPAGSTLSLAKIVRN